jgi:G:T-mismatch repair DNA endonuclease (very short patch repair protein)
MHGLTTAEYKMKFPTAKLWSRELIKEHSRIAREDRDNSVYIGLQQSKETRLRKSLALSGRKRSLASRRKQSYSERMFWRSEAGRRLASNLGRRSKDGTNMSIRMRNDWKDLEKSAVLLKGLRKGIFHNRMTKPEKKLSYLLRCNIPGKFYYNGTGKQKLVFDGAIPDFVWKKSKKVIEVFGSYWHGKLITGRNKAGEEKKRINRFRKLGWDCLVIWDYEFFDFDKLKNKVLRYGEV